MLLHAARWCVPYATIQGTPVNCASRHYAAAADKLATQTGIACMQLQLVLYVQFTLLHRQEP